MLGKMQMITLSLINSVSTNKETRHLTNYSEMENLMFLNMTQKRTKNLALIVL